MEIRITTRSGTVVDINHDGTITVAQATAPATEMSTVQGTLEPWTEVQYGPAVAPPGWVHDDQLGWVGPEGVQVTLSEPPNDPEGHEVPPTPEKSPEDLSLGQVSGWNYETNDWVRIDDEVFKPAPILPYEGERSDIGQQHHCSRCGTPGRRALARLNGRCFQCEEWEDENALYHREGLTWGGL